MLTLPISHSGGNERTAANCAWAAMNLEPFGRNRHHLASSEYAKKSTTSVHLAAWLHEQGHRVSLADCDAQQSSSQWMEEAYPEIETVQHDIRESLLDYANEFDYFIADGPGSNSEISRALLMVADFAIIPCKASMLEVRALAEATKLLIQARKIRRGEPPAMIILNMVRPRYRLAAEM